MGQSHIITENLKNHGTLVSICILALFQGSLLISAQKTSPSLFLVNKDSMIYTKDEFGNRIPDYSYCGYKTGKANIPNIPVKVIVPHTTQNAASKIQTAIDYVADLPADENGFRGTVLIEKGIFRLEGRLKINSTGVVLRGSGIGENGTVLIAAGINRETLISIAGKNDLSIGSEFQIMNPYVPVNSMELEVAPGHSLKQGDLIMIFRPVTKAWIDELDMNSFGGDTDWLGWKPGRDKILWDRTVLNIDDHSVTIDAPITTSIDSSYGGGSVFTYSWPGRICHVGIENLSLRSDYNTVSLKDEDHCWMAITIENAKDCWIRQVRFKYFAGSAVAIYETAKQITIEDCISTHAVSEIGGQRRNTFFTSGQQTLFQRCYAEDGCHDFAVGNFAPGPNAFVQCESQLPHNFSGSIDRWASGVLFDLVYIDGQAISLKNRMQEAQGAGWTAANSMIWQSSAALIECYSPPTATNWAFGVWGQFAGNGNWYEANSHIKPRSLYYAQLSDRLGNQVLERADFLPCNFGSTSSPSVELAQELSDNSILPIIRLKAWIESAAERNPIFSITENVKTIDQIRFEDKTNDSLLNNKVELKNGRLVINDRVVTGHTNGVRWWRGTVRPYDVSIATPHITRFVPGRTGLGYTDDLEEVTDWMQQNNVLAIDHNYGLWYDRRRDDHERIRRIDGDVWPPFYELPFARSGQDTAWDGLSKYDLTKPNIWYWQRLKEFADLADQKGLVLIHQNYFQHNILEAGAHWTDFPWRTDNNINNTGFPEPPPYAGDKRIFMADQFYDISNPVRLELHRNYIVQCLSNFIDNSNVIQLISAEYTGPLHFVEFWVDVIMEWEKVTRKNVLVCLSTTKDVQDAILNDPVRSKAVEIIDIRYWHYRENGSLYAPEGGKNLAPRQHARLVKPGKASFESVYRAVSEYRCAYPSLAVLYSNPLGKEHPWAVFMAGGSMAAIPKIEDTAFHTLASTLLPEESKSDDIFVMMSQEGEQILYCSTGKTIIVDLKQNKGIFTPIWIHPESGAIIKQECEIVGGKVHKLNSPVEEDIILWIKKN